jgi:hypothetical protein
MIWQEAAHAMFDRLKAITLADFGNGRRGKVS